MLCFDAERFGRLFERCNRKIFPSSLYAGYELLGHVHLFRQLFLRQIFILSYMRYFFADA